jgi:hypothetical protein
MKRIFQKKEIIRNKEILSNFYSIIIYNKILYLEDLNVGVFVITHFVYYFSHYLI